MNDSLQVVILAGGYGTRLGEMTDRLPKPMVEVGGYPLLWHIMKLYSFYGHNDFIICCGYKGYIIKEYFYNYCMHNSDMTINLETNEITYRKTNTEKWKITLVDTGIGTMTGKRIKMIQPYIKGDTFFLTYGDGLSNVDINKLATFHKSKNKIVTVTSVKPQARFGILDIDENSNVLSIKEKNKDNVHWINGGFFVFNKQVFDYIEGDVMLERQPLEHLVSIKEVSTYKHKGFWQCIDNMYELTTMEKLWREDKAKWKIWN